MRKWTSTAITMATPVIWTRCPGTPTTPVARRFRRLEGAQCMGVHDMYGNLFEWVEDWYGPDWP